MLAGLFDQNVAEKRDDECATVPRGGCMPVCLIGVHEYSIINGNV